MKDVKLWKKRMYCTFSKWLAFSDCSHCDGIFKMHLTLDGLRIAWKGQQLSFQKERLCIVKMYCRSAGFLVEQHN